VSALADKSPILLWISMMLSSYDLYQRLLCSCYQIRNFIKANSFGLGDPRFHSLYSGSWPSKISKGDIRHCDNARRGSSDCEYSKCVARRRCVASAAAAAAVMLMPYVRDIDRRTPRRAAPPHAVSYSTIYKATIYDMPGRWRWRSTAKSQTRRVSALARMDMRGAYAASAPPSVCTDAVSMQHHCVTACPRQSLYVSVMAQRATYYSRRSECIRP